ncbi:transglycosylase SLT domain-containing protein [Lysobacter cavernae]|uniref:Transglycosylase SLT domain-containing protein n=1 Tax=Lysobacter cavernae TaxID=1685901 RepID=A0ABV7RP04_9GAMM
MLPRPFIIVLAACVAALAASACAQSPAAPPATSTKLPTPPADPQLPRVRAAIEAAERGQYDAGQYADLARHPLFGWIEYAGLRRTIDTLPNAQGQAFLSRYNGQAVAATFREIWLPALARREDWPAFQAAWKPLPSDNLNKSTSLRCAELNARQALGRADAQWTRDAQAIWRSTGKSLPSECDAPLAVLAAQGGLTPELLWERIDLAAAEWQPGVMRSAARALPVDQQAQANDYAAFLDAPHARALGWPKTERSRRIASHGLAKLGKASPASAEAQLPQYAQALGFSEEDRGRVLYQVALWTVASYEPESARRLAAVPASAFDERLHEWRAREALARSDWRAALAAIEKMGTKQRGDTRWQYFEARLNERAGSKAAADKLYRAAAGKPDFHGFLAADKLGQSYALCPWLPNDSAPARAAIARDPVIVRAMGLFAIDRTGWAVREWDDALSRFDDSQRRLAVEVAQSHGWFDRAVFALGNFGGKSRPDELRLYHLRFPLHHDATIRREAARNRLDPAWIAAEIRAESVFQPRARSSANAMGLMQVLPTTGAAVARSLGLPWGGADSLYDSDTNIVLGSAYLRQLLDKYGGQPYQAIAGYNAGPAPLTRWQSQRPGMDPDFWIETISYKETRDYVARVLAFSVLYDWRLNGDALTLSERMRGRLDGPRKRFTCPLQSASSAPAPQPRASSQR